MLNVEGYSFTTLMESTPQNDGAYFVFNLPSNKIYSRLINGHYNFVLPNQFKNQFHAHLVLCCSSCMWRCPLVSFCSFNRWDGTWICPSGYLLRFLCSPVYSADSRTDRPLVLHASCLQCCVRFLRRLPEHVVYVVAAVRLRGTMVSGQVGRCANWLLFSLYVGVGDWRGRR
jgi:hypothetical protein